MTADEIIGRQMWDLMKALATAAARVAELEAKLAEPKPSEKPVE